MQLFMAVIAAAAVATAAAVHASGATATGSSDTQAIRAPYASYSCDVNARNLTGIMFLYAPRARLAAFDAFGPPSETIGKAAYRRGFRCGKYFALFPGPIKETITNLHIVTSDSLSYACGYDRWTASPRSGSKPLSQIHRFTDVFQKIDGRWLIVYEHLSFPVNPRDINAVLLSRS